MVNLLSISFFVLSLNKGVGDLTDFSILWSGSNEQISVLVKDSNYSENARIFFQALQFYNNENFEQAHNLFEQVIDRNIQSREAGLSLVFLGKISTKGQSPERSLSYFLDAHKKYSGVLDPLSKIFTLSYASAIYAQAGEFRQAGFYSQLIQGELRNLPSDFYAKNNFDSMINIFSSRRKVKGWLDYSALVSELTIGNQLLTQFIDSKKVPHRELISERILSNIKTLEREGNKIITVKKGLLTFQPHLRASEKVNLTILNHIESLEGLILGLNDESKKLLEELQKLKKSKIYLSVKNSVQSKMTQESKIIEKSGSIPNYSLPPMFNDLIMDSDPNLR